jgi:hypothetical protein
MTGHEGGDLSLSQDDGILPPGVPGIPLDQLGQLGERRGGVDLAPFGPLKSGLFEDVPRKEEKAPGDDCKKHQSNGENEATCATELHGSKTIAPAYISRLYKKICSVT